jgi:curved DNA-binding protein CbpA
MKYHPDRNKSAIANEMTKKINEAHAILIDQSTRYIYDHHSDLKKECYSHYNTMCNHCGATNPSEPKLYCTNCGSKIKNNYSSTEYESDYTTGYHPKSKIGKIIMWIFILFPFISMGGSYLIPHIINYIETNTEKSYIRTITVDSNYYYTPQGFSDFIEYDLVKAPKNIEVPMHIRGHDNESNYYDLFYNRIEFDENGGFNESEYSFDYGDVLTYQCMDSFFKEEMCYLH